MRERLLVIGAEPRAFIGPWIDLTDSKVWEARPSQDFAGRVFVETGDGRVLPLNGEPITFGSNRARAIIDERCEVTPITVKLRQVK